jgi:anti-sigma regulatory factor (Ser/Thr protein kinase)
MADLLPSPLRLRIASTAVHLPIVRAAVERLAVMMSFDEDTAGKIMLAVDEALTNIIRHAYDGREDGPIEITFRNTVTAAGENALCIELRDWGTSARPEEIRSRDLEDIRPGGLGVHIMSSVMDQVKYEPQRGGGTRLTMTKTVGVRSI